MKVISEDDGQLVIGFRFLEKTLPKKYDFFADCDATYTIDKTSKKVVSGTMKNFRPTKVSFIKVPELEMTMDFVFLDDAEGYHITREQMDITLQILGTEAQSTVMIEYTDFEKVK